MSLVRDTATSAVATVVLTGSRLIVAFMLARLLSPAVYGQFAFAQWMIDLIFMICSLGLPGAMTRFLPAIGGLRAEVSRRLLRSIFGFSAVALAVSVAMFWIYLAVDLPGPLHMTLSLLLWCASALLVALLTPALQGLFRFDAIMVGNLVFAIAAPVSVAVLVRSPSLEGAALALAIAWLLNAAASFITIRARAPASATVPVGNVISGKYVAGYAMRTWLTTLISGLVWSRGELGILKLRVDSAHVAFYSLALTLAGAVTQGAALLTGALTSHLVRHWHAGDPHRMARILRVITQGVLSLTVVAALGLIGAGQLVLPLILGADYQETYPILAILSVASISIACGCANTVLQIETNAKFGLLINVVGLITLVVLSVAMTPFIGVLGAAAARAIAQTIVALAAFGRLGKMAGMASVGRDLSSAYLLAVAALTAFCITIGLLNPGPVARIIGAMLIGTVLCMAIRAIIKVPFATFAQLGSRMREPDTA